MLAGSPSKVATVNPAHSASAASSVKSLRPSRAARRWASRMTSKRNACGVCAMRSRARSGVASTLPVSPTSLMVSVTAIAGTAAPVRAGGLDRARNHRRRDERPRGVVDQDDVRLLAGERFESGMHRGLARRAAIGGRLHGASALTASLKIAVSSGLSTGCTAKICGWRQNASIARKITVWPPIERYCFGPPAPARRPRPAATRMAAVRSGLGMGLELRAIQG